MLYLQNLAPFRHCLRCRRHPVITQPGSDVPHGHRERCSPISSLLSFSLDFREHSTHSGYLRW